MQLRSTQATIGLSNDVNLQMTDELMKIKKDFLHDS